MNIFGLNAVVEFGSEEQKHRMLPPLIAGEHRTCFMVTEPNTGLNTTQLTSHDSRGARQRSLCVAWSEDFYLDRQCRREDVETVLTYTPPRMMRVRNS
ncbi:hypothetical protein D3C76_1533830 [compost metagenome]